MSNQANRETARFWGPALASVDAAPITKAPANALGRARQIKDFENAILERALSVSDDVLHFAEIDPEAAEPPEEWIQELGKARARERLRIAKAAWKGANEAPVGIRTAQQLAGSIIKARSVEKSGPRTLNVGVVNLSAPLPEFPVVDVEAEGE